MSIKGVAYQATLTRRNYSRLMKAAFVILTYNNENHVVEAMDSIRNQTLSDWICVMIDNGSTDATFEVIQKNIEGDGRFTAVKKTNEGPAAGRNLGFSKLNEDIEYIHFLDGDDVLKPLFMERLTKYLDAHPKVGLAACQFDEMDYDSNDCGKGHRSRFAPALFGFPHDIPLSEFNTPFVSFFASTAVGPYGVYRRSVFVQTGGYLLKSQEDTDMFCQMSLLAEVHYLPEYLYRKRRHTSNLAHNKSYISTHHVFRDKWDLYQSDNPEITRKIEEAIYYYYNRHKPLRDFKVAMKAFKKSLKKRDLHSFKWSMECIGSGFIEILFKKSYREVMARREQQTQSDT